MTKLNFDEIELRNYFLRLQMMEETGISPENDYSPVFENVWLSACIKSEEQKRNSNKITIRSYLDNPVFIPADELSKFDLSFHLSHLLKLLEENKIGIENIHDFDDEIIYSFITEDLMECEIDFPGVDCSYTTRINENYWPKRDNLKKTALDILKRIFSKDKPEDNYQFQIYTALAVNETKFRGREFFNFIELFHELHEHLSIKYYKLISIQYQPEGTAAIVNFQFDYEMKVSGMKVSITNETVTMHFEKIWSSWELCCIETAAFGTE